MAEDKWGFEENADGKAPSFGRGFSKRQNSESQLGKNNSTSYKNTQDDWKNENKGGDTNEDEWNEDGVGSNNNNWEPKQNSNGWAPQSDNRKNGSGDSWEPKNDVPHGGGYKRGGPMVCNKCKEEGHMSRDCPSGGGGGRACFKCNEEGHMSRDCPSGGGGGGRACFKCNEEGHMSRDCPKAGSSNSRACFKCNEEGHMSRDCPKGGSSNSRACFKCNEEGHMSRDCPNATSSSSRACHKCNQEGHMARDCPTGGSRGPQTCYNCNGEGHMSRDCPEPRSNTRNRSCKKCGSDQHSTPSCPESRNEDDDTPFSYSEGRRGGGGSNTCNRCKKEGHLARECTEEVTDESGRKLMMPYVPPDLTGDEDTLFHSNVNTGINFDKYDNIKVTLNGKERHKTLDTFDSDVLRDLLKKNISKAGYKKPTPIQKSCIPSVLAGRDVMACAQTGSGKTAAFLVPIINSLLAANDDPGTGAETTQPIALVISPTRELTIQIHAEGKKFAWDSIIKCGIAYGGTTVGHQLGQLQRSGCHVLVATIGRLNDFVRKGKVSFERLKYLVLDEADRMLDMGFESAIRELLEHPSMPDADNRQTMMFSATFPSKIQQLARNFLRKNYDFVVVGSVGGANADVNQTFEQVERKEKIDKLKQLLKDLVAENKKVLVFAETQRQTDFLGLRVCQEDIKATTIHGARLQRERETALNDFKSGKMQVLIATAVAARGLDIRGVDYVINYDMPKEIDEYVHRIGRTGRVGNIGNAISFFESGRDDALISPLLKILGDAQQVVPEWMERATFGSTSGDYNSDGFGASRDVRRDEDGYEAITKSKDEEEWD